MNPDKQNIDHLSYWKLLIKEVIVSRIWWSEPVHRAKSWHYERKSNQTNWKTLY